MGELLPCPFCGSPATLDCMFEGASSFKVECGNRDLTCPASMIQWWHDRDKAVAAWNHRVNAHAEQAAVVARVTVLAEGYKAEALALRSDLAKAEYREEQARGQLGREAEHARIWKEECGRLYGERDTLRGQRAGLLAALEDAVEWLQPHTLAVQDVKRNAERAIAAARVKGKPATPPGRPSELPLMVEVTVDNDGALITAAQGPITAPELLEIDRCLDSDDFFSPDRARGVYLCRPTYESGLRERDEPAWRIDGADRISDLSKATPPGADPVHEQQVEAHQHSATDPHHDVLYPIHGEGK